MRFRRRLEGEVKNIMDFPLFLFVCSFIVLWASARVGVFLHLKSRSQQEDDSHDLDFVTGGVLTLLGLLIGFSFSMAITRYDQRKNYEEEEANAIGTEYVRLDLLPGEEGVAIQQQLKKYLDQRILFYQARNTSSILDRINADTARLQNEMWSKVKTVAAPNPNPVMALVVSGMNDVLNRQGYTQAIWWNRIPPAAWGLMFLISIGCSFLVGYAVRRSGGGVLLVIPLAVSISFLLIADIDSPRGGLIRVAPQNLLSLSQSLQSQ
jgi:hypothetical protein